MTDQTVLTDEAKTDFTAICCAELCTIVSLNLNYPACLGCSSSGICCCFSIEEQQCYPTCVDGVDVPGVKDDVLCVCQKGECLVIKPPILTGGPICKMTISQCCIDQRCAIPCDKEVPPTCTICFFTLCQGDPPISNMKSVMKPFVPPPPIVFGDNAGTPPAMEMER